MVGQALNTFIARLKSLVKLVSTMTERQPGNYECGYYMMKHFLNIVFTTIIGSWMEVLNDNAIPFLEEEIMTSRGIGQSSSYALNFFKDVTIEDLQSSS
ncbi:hypothetical protein CR513_28604, partial [Mucuna pruriens]